MFDMRPTATALAALIARIRDDQLTAPTPCAEARAGDLVVHLDDFCQAFAAAARKTPLPGPPPQADVARLADHWRITIPRRLEDLAYAWRDERAWDGMTQAGGIDMPAGAAGLVAADEMAVHGWDLAVATGQPFEPDGAIVSAALEFVAPQVAQNPHGTPGLFGPPLSAPDGASDFERLLCLTGRDPQWSSTSNGDFTTQQQECEQ